MDNVHLRKKAFHAFALSGVMLSCSINAQSATFSTYTGPLYQHSPLAKGVDGNVWLITGTSSTGGQQQVTRINTNGTTNSFNLSGSSSVYYDGLLAGPDGKFWLNDSTNSEPRIARTSASGGTVEVLKRLEPQEYIFGPVDRYGKIWLFADGYDGTSQINSAGTLQRLKLDPDLPNYRYESVLGRNGDVWFISNGLVGKITPGGSVSTFAYPGNVTLSDITLGPDGNIWVVSDGTSPISVGKITPAGTITNYTITPPDTLPSPAWNCITPGPDGNLWVSGGIAIGQVTTAGVATFYIRAPGVNEWTSCGVVGNDGRMWFSRYQGNTIDVASNFGTPTPTNDNFANALAITAGSGFQSTNNFSATAELGEPAHAGVAAQSTLWWTWTAPSSSEAVFATHGSSHETTLAIFTGNSVNALTPVASSANRGLGASAVTFQAQAGTVYRIAVGGHPSQKGTVYLDWRTRSRAADLSLSIATNEEEPENSFIYEMTVINDGPSEASNVSATISLPPQMVAQVPDGSGCVKSSPTEVTCSLATMNPGQYTFQIYISPTESGNYQASATVTSDQPDPSPLDNDITITTPVTVIPSTGKQVPAETQGGIAALALILCGLGLAAARKQQLSA